MSRVAIVHPWFPQYREAFFELLIKSAREYGITVDIYHGAPPPEWAERKDSVRRTYATPVVTRFLPVRGKSLVIKSLRKLRQNGPYDLIILEQAVRNLESYPLLLGPHTAAVALWGHGKTYTDNVSRAQEFVKFWLTRRSDWFFAYTQGGRDAVIAAGFPAEKVTVVQNTIDSKALRRGIQSLQPQQVSDYRRRLDLTRKTALYIGGLDDSKRVPFLLEAGRVAHCLDPEFRLLIAGSGPLRSHVEDMAASSDWLKFVGPVFGESKTLALKVARVLVMPGRVGLVAVDSFAAGLPIMTTEWKFHAPEFEYLQDGYNAVVLGDDTDAPSYGESMINLLQSPSRLERLSMAASESMTKYTTENMVDNFMGGIRGVLASKASKERIEDRTDGH